MSARLIKSGQELDTKNYSAFAPPEELRRDGSATGLSSQRELVSAADTQSTAEQIIAQANAKAAQIEQQAQENARALMQAEVEAEVSRLITPWHQQIGASLQEIAGLRATVTAQSERELVRLAIEIAKKIVHREVTIDSEIVMTLARIGLSRLHNRVAATIHLHPDDFAYMSAHREQIDAGHALELVEDRSIGRGGCLVHTEMGDVDTRIEQQFAEIERAFLGL